MQTSSVEEAQSVELTNNRVPLRSQRRTNFRQSVKAWYARAVLRSGKGYESLPDRTPPESHFHGWRFGALISCVVVGLCLALNVIVTIYLRAIYHDNEGKDNLAVLMTDECDKVKDVDSKVHYALNMIATILVSASNYNMQCLTAPTRREVSNTHRRGRWLDIGVHSLRNLSHIGPIKPQLWLLLLLSSLPLHLLWNSAIFMTTTLNDFNGMVVTRDFVKGNSSIGIDCSAAAMQEYRSHDQERYVACSLRQRAHEDGQGNMTRLDPKDCMSTYEAGIAGTTFNLVAVTKENANEQSKTFPPPTNITLPVIGYFRPLDYPKQISDWCEGLCHEWAPKGSSADIACSDSNRDTSSIPMTCRQRMMSDTPWEPDAFSQTNYWMCHTDAILLGHCSGSEAQKNASSWLVLPEQYEIDYCLTTPATHSCQLKYSTLIIYITIVCNAVKFLSILLCLRISHEPIFATVGDALASFLQIPEPETEGRCLMSRLEGSLALAKDAGYKRSSTLYPPQAEWKERWYRGASVQRWGVCTLLWLASVMVGVYFLCSSIANFSIQDSFNTGLGALSLRAIVSASTYEGGTMASILTTSLIANLPQLLLSGLYFMYNAIITGMYSAYEWSLFGYKRSTLRVTLPSGAQRETYWLQLPWRYSLPLVICCTAFHWLMSQSIFLINLRIYQPNDELLTTPSRHFPSASPSGVITACGYSPLAVLCALAVGFGMLLALLIISCWKLKPGIPVVGSCSLAMSAACHAPETDEDAAVRPLSWGAIRHEEGSRAGHCCLTSLEVEKPRNGRSYI